MKKILSLFTLLIALNSCQKELNFDTPVQSTAACKSCSYVPFCSGSVYTYVDSTAAGIDTTTETISIIKDTTINGKVYQQYPYATGFGYYNCTAGVSTTIVNDVAPVGGAMVTIEQTLLKANEPVGATWQNVLTVAPGQNLDFNYSLVAKGLTRTVLGVTYNDVIHVKLSIGIMVPIIGAVVLSKTDFFYANNIGLIESIVYADQSGMQTLVLHRRLKSYSIP